MKAYMHDQKLKNVKNVSVFCHPKNFQKYGRFLLCITYTTLSMFIKFWVRNIAYIRPYNNSFFYVLDKYKHVETAF